MVFTVTLESDMSSLDPWSSTHHKMVYQPEMTLREVRMVVCTRRELDPKDYTFQPSKDVQHDIKLDARLGDLGAVLLAVSLC
jgi:hypothetical protein